VLWRGQCPEKKKVSDGRMAEDPRDAENSSLCGPPRSNPAGAGQSAPDTGGTVKRAKPPKQRSLKKSSQTEPLPWDQICKACPRDSFEKPAWSLVLPESRPGWDERAKSASASATHDHPG
jgi:hypothetical protein